jgi:hypothetical protein
MLPLKEIEILLALEKQINNLKQKIWESQSELQTLEFSKFQKLEEISLRQTQVVKLEVEKENFVKELTSAKNKEQNAILKLEKLAKEKLLAWLQLQTDILVDNEAINASLITKLPNSITIKGKQISISEIIKKLITN